MTCKFSFNVFLDYACCVLFGIVFFTIPSFSFQKSTMVITWIFTLLLFATIFFSFLYKKADFKINFISLSFLLFPVSAFLSSLLNDFSGFKITPIALSIVAFIVYSYCYSFKYGSKFIFSSYIGIICFLFLFIFRYRNNLITFSFNRLGGLFGDINDVSLFFSLGICLAAYYLFFTKKIFYKVLNVVLFCFFALCGISTGSKIFLLSSFATIFVILFLFFGKKKWYISLGIIFLFIISFILLINIPAFKSYKTRLLDFLSTLNGRHIKGANYKNDYSTIFRIHMFIDGIEMFLRKPIFGYGIWGFATHGGINGGWSHNNFSESLCNFGLLGTAIFHYCFYASIKEFAIHKSNEYKFSFSIIVMFICFMFSVALNSEKIYAFLIGAVVGMASMNIEPIFSFNLCKTLRKQDENIGNY